MTEATSEEAAASNGNENKVFACAIEVISYQLLSSFASMISI